MEKKDTYVLGRYKEKFISKIIDININPPHALKTATI